MYEVITWDNVQRLVVEAFQLQRSISRGIWADEQSSPPAFEFREARSALVKPMGIQGSLRIAPEKSRFLPRGHCRIGFSLRSFVTRKTDLCLTVEIINVKRLNIRP